MSGLVVCDFDWYINRHRKVLAKRKEEEENKEETEKKLKLKKENDYITKCCKHVINDLKEKVKDDTTPKDGYFCNCLDIKNEFYDNNRAIVNKLGDKLREYYEDIPNIKFRVGFKTISNDKGFIIQMKYELTIQI